MPCLQLRSQRPVSESFMQQMRQLYPYHVIKLIVDPEFTSPPADQEPKESVRFPNYASMIRQKPGDSDCRNQQD